MENEKIVQDTMTDPKLEGPQTGIFHRDLRQAYLDDEEETDVVTKPVKKTT
jgi:hypothetical protein